jgi:hypothetical protein
LRAYEFGYRAVSVEEAACGVPRASSLLVDIAARCAQCSVDCEPVVQAGAAESVHDARVAFMPVDHKLARWLVYPALLFAKSGRRPPAASGRGPACCSPRITAALVAYEAVARVKRRASSSLARLCHGSQRRGVVTANLRGAKQGIWEPTRRA